jgi:WD40 repeat protein
MRLVRRLKGVAAVRRIGITPLLVGEAGVLVKQRARDNAVGDALGDTVTSTQDAVDAPRTTSAQPADPASRYVVLREVARGGLGRILEARDERLERAVAIKELLAATPSVRDRFQREAAITARLQHPAIVPIYDTGQWDNGEPYYVMKLLSDGRTLKELVAEAPDLDARLALVPNVLTVADAIAYAHSSRIIHRDLKPSNVIVGSFGETVVIDWGLGKDLAARPEQDATTDPFRTAAPDATAAGSILGTPMYMAPEQARGNAVDERADVYALGAILYFVLVGETPYQGDHASDVLGAVLHGPPRAPLERVPGVPRDLDAIVNKAMARDPERRYRNASELAADLRLFQTGQLVQAHRYTRSQLLGRWLARHRTPVVISTLFTLTLAMLAILGVRQIVRERDRAEGRANALILAQARALLDKDPTASLAWLKTYPRSGHDWPAVRELAMHALGAGVARHVFRRDDKDAPSSAFSHDSARFVSAGSDRRIELRDVRSGALLTARAYERHPGAFAFSEDDRDLVFSEGSILRRWTLATGAVATLQQVGAAITGIVIASGGGFIAVTTENSSIELLRGDGTKLRAFTDLAQSGFDFAPDAHSAVATGPDGSLQLWNLTTMQVAQVLKSAGRDVSGVRFSPDGARIAVLRAAGTLALCDVAAAACHPISTPAEHVSSFDFSPDGKQIAGTTTDYTTRLWDCATGTEQRAWHTERAMIVTFSRNGRELFIRGDDPKDATVRVVDIEDGEREILRQHTYFVSQLAQTTDGRVLASAGFDRKTRLWNFDPPARRSLGRHDDQVQQVVQFRDGRHLASASRDQTVRIWDLDSGVQRVFREPRALVYRVAVTRDGTRIAAGGFDAIVHTWSLRDGTYRGLVGHKVTVWDVAFSPDEKLLASASADGTIRLWDERGELVRVLTGHRGEVSKVVFSPDGQTLASSGEDGTIRLWNPRTGGARVWSGHHDAVTRLMFLADGAQLVSAGREGDVRRWDVATGVGRLLGRTSGQIMALTSSADGRQIAAAGMDPRIRVWTIASGEERVLEGHEDMVRDLAFSPDGRQLASASGDRTLRLWTLPTGRLEAILPNPSAIMSVSFVADGVHLVAADRSGGVGVWNLDRVPRVPSEPREILPWLDKQTTATLDALRP